MGKNLSSILQVFLLQPLHKFNVIFSNIKKRYRDCRRHGLKHALSIGTISHDKTLAGNGRIADETKPLQSDFSRDKSFIMDSSTLEAHDSYPNILTEDTDAIDIEKGSIPHSPGSHKSTTSSENEEENSQALSLLIFFGLYIFCGAALLSAYEPDMSFFKAIYFNFVSLSSIGTLTSSNKLTPILILYRSWRHISQE